MTTTNHQPVAADVVAGLRSATTDPGDLLCIELLAADGYWWTRQDFIDSCVTWFDDVPTFDPAEAINVAHLDRRASESHLAFLRLALSFALIYEVAFYDTIRHLDRHQLVLVLIAIARQSRHSAPITVDGCLRTRLPFDDREVRR